MKSVSGTIQSYEELLNNPQKRKFPQRVIIELTNKCNFTCSMCPRRFMGDAVGYMNFNIFKKIIDEVARYPGTIITPFFRGESLMHPQFIQCMKYIRSKTTVPILLASNAYFLDKKKADALLSLSLDFISFSVDSVDEHAYRLMRRGNLEDIKDNILYFLRKKESLHLKKPEIQVSAVDTKDSHSGIKRFVYYWRNIADRVRIYPEHSKRGKFGALENNSHTRRYPCFKPMNEIVIYWNGVVGLCNHDWNHPLSLGNVRRASIVSVWSSEAYEKVRCAHYTIKLTKNMPCYHCDHWRMYYNPEKIVGRLYKGLKKRITYKDVYAHD